MTECHTHGCCDRTEHAGDPLATIDETIDQALALSMPVAGTETVTVQDAVGRTAANDIVSLFPLPLYDHSAVDGYALSRPGKAKQRIIGRIPAGDLATTPLKGGQAMRIFTGAPVPPGTAAVVMQEHAEVVDGHVEPTFNVPEGDNIRRTGEDVTAMHRLLSAGAQLDARHTAILVASGYQSVSVTRKVKVAILSTGNELRDAGVGMGQGSIFDTNRPMLSALLASNAAEVTDLGIKPDDRDVIAATLKAAAETHDLIITSGGVSVGEEDHLKPAVLAAGGKIGSWRMAIKPGKPVALGKVGEAVYLGLPGNPLACFVDFLLLGRPILRALAGAHTMPLKSLQAQAAFSWTRRTGRTEFFPVNVVGTSTDGLPLLEKTGRAGSSRLLPLIEADGLGMVDADVADIGPGTALQFFPFRVCMGL